MVAKSPKATIVRRSRSSVASRRSRSMFPKHAAQKMRRLRRSRPSRSTELKSERTKSGRAATRPLCVRRQLPKRRDEVAGRRRGERRAHALGELLEGEPARGQMLAQRPDRSLAVVVGGADEVATHATPRACMTSTTSCGCRRAFAENLRLLPLSLGHEQPQLLELRRGRGYRRPGQRLLLRAEPPGHGRDIAAD